MRIAALTSFFVAAAATVVAAAPGPNETTERVSYKDTRPAPKGDGWVELASPTPTSHGREFIAVGVDAGAFTRLRLDAAKGRPIVKTVRVDYADGSSRVFPISKALGKDPVYVDLRGGHEIDRIIVAADTSSHGSYTVRGTGESQGVASR